MPSTRRDGGGDLTGVYRAHIMDDRERTRRQLALETKRRQKLFEEKAKRRQMEEEKLVRLARAPTDLDSSVNADSSRSPVQHVLL